jgi:hypothetical protein
VSEAAAEAEVATELEVWVGEALALAVAEEVWE